MDEFYRDGDKIVINHFHTGVKTTKGFASVNAAKRASRDMQKAGAKYIPFIMWKKANSEVNSNET
jgi:hypothetical protein